MANSYAISTFQASVPFSELYSQSGHIHKDKNNNNKNAQIHPVLAARKAWFCCWKRTVATVQLEEIFQETGNALAVNELFFARMLDSSCAPVNSLPWETNRLLLRISRRSAKGPLWGQPHRCLSHRRLTYKSPQPQVHSYSSFCLLGPYSGPREGPRKATVPLPSPLNCPLVRFPHLQHHDIWNCISLHIFCLSCRNCIYFHALVFIKLSRDDYVCSLFSFHFFKVGLSPK